MKTLYMTKGLPGSGKTTWALEHLSKHPDCKRVNKDDLRAMLDGGKWSRANESFVKKIRNFIVGSALNEDFSVIVDDTNLHASHEKTLQDMAKIFGAEFEVKSFLDVPIETCIERDLKRLKSVGEKVVRKMAREFRLDDIKVMPLEQDHTLPKAIICDIDGTIAWKGDRSPYDWHRVVEDAPNRAVINLLLRLQVDREIILFSGRDSVCRKDTETWLLGHFVPFSKLYMRPEGNCEKDSIIKQRMFDEHVRGKYFVDFVLDDRNQVVEMWRENGLQCFQVADGNF